MPNPKTGTVTNDIASAIKEIKNGKIAYRMDKDGNLVNFRQGQFDVETWDNLKVVVETVTKARPAAVKGVYIRSCTISSTLWARHPHCSLIFSRSLRFSGCLNIPKTVTARAQRGLIRYRGYE